MAQEPGWQDRYGLTLTASSPTAVARYVMGLDQFLAADVGAEASLAQAIEADAAFALAHAALALMQQLQGLPQPAKLGIARARTRLADLSRRERQCIEAIATFVEAGATRAYSLVHAHLDEFPRDVLLLFLHSFLTARSGRPSSTKRSWPFWMACDDLFPRLYAPTSGFRPVAMGLHVGEEGGF